MNFDLSPEDQQRLDAACEEFDPATHELTRPYFDGLTDWEERDFVVSHYRASLRRRLWGAFLLDALASHLHASYQGLYEIGEAMILDELEREDPWRPRSDNGRFGPTRQWTCDVLTYFFGNREFACNRILCKVNQGMGREVGEAQDRFLSLVDLAIYSLFPRWLEIRLGSELDGMLDSAGGD